MAMTIDERIKEAKKKRNEAYKKDSVQGIVYWDGYLDALKHIKADADVFEAVRCRDCIHWDSDNMGCPDDDTLADYAVCLKCSNSIENIYVKPDDFCSYGERSENGKS